MVYTVQYCQNIHLSFLDGICAKIRLIRLSRYTSNIFKQTVPSMLISRHCMKKSGGAMVPVKLQCRGVLLIWRGRSDSAMVLEYLPVPERPTNLDKSM